MNKELKEVIQKDIFRYYGAYKIPFSQKVLPYNMGLKYIILYRKANYYWYKKSIKRFFYQYKLKKLSLKLGFQIHPMTKIGVGFYLGHIGTTIVNPEAVIGNNVSLAQGVTIGVHVRGIKKGAPTIGDRVYIGANAVIVGKITIGNNVVIAPNSFVNIDIPSNSIVLGNPATIKPNEKATDGFLTYIV